MKETDKERKLRVVEGSDPEFAAPNAKVLTCLRHALMEAESLGWTEVCIVMARPMEGYMASMAVEEGDKDGSGRGSIFNLIGAVAMTDKFLKEVAVKEQ